MSAYRSDGAGGGVNDGTAALSQYEWKRVACHAVLLLFARWQHQYRPSVSTRSQSPPMSFNIGWVTSRKDRRPDAVNLGKLVGLDADVKWINQSTNQSTSQQHALKCTSQWATTELQNATVGGFMWRNRRHADHLSTWYTVTWYTFVWSGQQIFWEMNIIYRSHFGLLLWAVRKTFTFESFINFMNFMKYFKHNCWKFHQRKQIFKY